MKTLFYFIFLLSLIFLPPAHARNDDSDDWYPFVLGEKMDPDSPLNIGKLVLDPPAGKHGFVKVKDGHFYFEDGTRAKFWGTNLCFSANFPDKKQAEMIADRLAFFGFNAVRLHHMDSAFEPHGIFKDVAPAYKDPQMKKTGVLSEKQLDRLDYLIYLLKQRGIYVDMNLLVSRHFTEADGVKDADRLVIAAKPVSMFDPRLIELQKQYAKDLLTHYNPYTKMRYCDDPTVALVEITNENSIIIAWKQGKFDHNNKDALPTFYLDQIDEKWQKWQKKNLLFTQEDWKAFFTNLTREYIKEMSSFLNNECGIKIPITGIGGYSHGGNLDEEDLTAQESCDFIDVHSYWDHPRFPVPENRNAFQIYNHSMLKNEYIGIIGYSLKRQAPLLQKFLKEKDIKNLINELKSGESKETMSSKPFTISEWNHCYPNEYAYETPPLLASFAKELEWDAIFQFAFSHLIYNQMSYDKIADMAVFDTIANPQQLILASISSILFHEKAKISMQIKNQIFFADSPLIKGIVGEIKDQSFQFNQFEITPLDNGAVFIFLLDNSQAGKYIGISISKIKNTDSKWSRKGIYQWGTGPTLLKKLPVKISIRNTANCRVYVLDQKGRPGREIPIAEDIRREGFSTATFSSPWFGIDISLSGEDSNQNHK